MSADERVEAIILAAAESPDLAEQFVAQYRGLAASQSVPRTSQSPPQERSFHAHFFRTVFTVLFSLGAVVGGGSALTEYPWGHPSALVLLGCVITGAMFDAFFSFFFTLVAWGVYELPQTDDERRR